MAADLVLALRSILHRADVGLWSPVTLVYAEYSGTLGLFVRAQERRVFKRLSLTLGVADKEDLTARLSTWSNTRKGDLEWLLNAASLDLAVLMGLEKLDSVGT